MENMYRYEACARWVERRRGIVEGEQLPQVAEFAAPPEFGGESGYWTPEHLLMGALASCFVSTFVAIAEYSKFRFHDVRVKVNGKLEKVEGGFRFTEVQVSPTLWVIDGADEEQGMKLLEKAKKACLISRSMNSQFTLEATVLAGADALPGQTASGCRS